MGESGSRRLAYLDGIRGFAIFFLVLGHFRQTHPTLFLGLDGILPDAGSGLRIFFVLSGFLITMLLRRDPPGQTPLQRLKNFYRRRLFKLVPPLVLFVGIVVLIDRLTIKTCGPGAIVSALTFLTAFRLGGNFPTDCLELTHTWSLTIEEVFYVGWAPMVIFFRRRTTVPLALLAVAAAGPLEVMTWAADQHRFQSWLSQIPNFRFFINFGYLGVGALLAEVLVSDFWRRRQPALSTLRWSVGLITGTTLLFHSLAYFTRWPALTLPFINLVDAIFIAGLILLCVANPRGIVCRTLSLAPLRSLGVISYSLYLWQQLFARYTPTPNHTYPWQSLPTAAGLTLAAGFFSYYFIERNFVKLSRKYSSGTLVLSEYKAKDVHEKRPKAA